MVLLLLQGRALWSCGQLTGRFPDVLPTTRYLEDRQPDSK